MLHWLQQSGSLTTGGTNILIGRNGGSSGTVIFSYNWYLWVML